MRTFSSNPRAARRARHHLAATLAVAALAVAGTTISPETTGALYAASSTSTLAGFQVQPLCDFDSYTSVPELLADLSPTAHWGFDPEAAPEGWTAMGTPLPAPAPPDGTLLCDDGVLPLAAGQSVSSTAALGSPATVVLVLGTSSIDGTVLTLLADDGGADVTVSGTDVTLRAWADGDAPITVATGLLDAGSVHVLAVTVDGSAVTLWIDGAASTVGTVPAEITGTLGGAGFGLGTLVTLDPAHHVATASVTATELAVVGAALDQPTLDSLHAAAVPGP